MTRSGWTYIPPRDSYSGGGADPRSAGPVRGRCGSCCRCRGDIDPLAAGKLPFVARPAFEAARGRGFLRDSPRLCDSPGRTRTSDHPVNSSNRAPNGGKRLSSSFVNPGPLCLFAKICQHPSCAASGPFAGPLYLLRAGGGRRRPPVLGFYFAAQQPVSDVIELQVGAPFRLKNSRSFGSSAVSASTSASSVYISQGTLSESTTQNLFAFA